MCIESAQNVFDRLLLRDSMSDDDELNFDVLAVVAADSQGKIDEDTLKDLIKVFRPDRDGRLSRLAFVKSVDTVYKRLRLLGANVHNSSQIDIAIEKIINVGFYFVLGCIILACLGFQPLQLFFSLSSPILAFSFMVSTAAAQYFEVSTSSFDSRLWQATMYWLPQTMSLTQICLFAAISGRTADTGPTPVW